MAFQKSVLKIYKPWFKLLPQLYIESVLKGNECRNPFRERERRRFEGKERGKKISAITVKLHWEVKFVGMGLTSPDPRSNNQTSE